MVAPGALTVVPLPAADYGTTTAPGGTALPAVGAPIDPALRPVAPAARLGLATNHVDPTTGRRGIAFKLANEETDAFLVYAAAHKYGEYVAVVLDGVVLATLAGRRDDGEGPFRVCRRLHRGRDPSARHVPLQRPHLVRASTDQRHRDPDALTGRADALAISGVGALVRSGARLRRLSGRGAVW